MGIGNLKALVVYSSPAGTTRHVAQVIVDALRDLRYEPDEWVFLKERRNKGARAGFHKRDERYEEFK